MGIHTESGSLREASDDGDSHRECGSLREASDDGDSHRECGSLRETSDDGDSHREWVIERSVGRWRFTQRVGH